MSATQPPHAYDPRWYSAALKQVADARWKHEPLLSITGPASVGKTTLCRQIADRPGTRTFVVLVSAPPTGNALLRAIAIEVGALSKTAAAATPITNDELQQILRQFLGTVATLKADCLVIVDDAHRLKVDALEEIRALLDSPNGRRSSLQFVLVGLSSEATATAPVAAAASSLIDVSSPVRLPEPLPVDAVAVAPTEPVAAAPDTIETYPSELAQPESIDAAVLPRQRPSSRRIGVVNGLLAAGAVAACGVAWYGVAHRRQATPVAETEEAEPAPAPPRPEETALAKIVNEADAATAAAERQSPPLALPDGPGWTDEVARRAAILARRPDIEGLVALRSAVEAKRAADAANAPRVDAALRLVDQRLDEARKRQLALDRQHLLTTPKNR